MKTIDKTYEINAQINNVWKALTDATIIDRWKGGPAKFDATEGGEFSLWGGDIHGTNIAVVENKTLKQDWSSHYNQDKFYKVTFTLSKNGDATTVHLTHADIPDGEVEDFEAGWEDYYFNPIKQLLEK